MDSVSPHPTKTEKEKVYIYIYIYIYMLIIQKRLITLRISVPLDFIHPLVFSTEQNVMETTSFNLFT
jgi:hypothetical protein